MAGRVLGRFAAQIWLVAATAVPLWSTGCTLFYSHQANDGDAMAPADGGGDGPRIDGPASARCAKLDVVMVIDDSGSMAAVHNNLMNRLPRFVDDLAAEVSDFRVAITTTSRTFDYTLDVFGQLMPQHEVGDDGAFRTTCTSVRPFVDRDDSDARSLVACRAVVGTNSGFEMPLLMSRRALAERVADGSNAGVVRGDAPLALLYVTDEDDQSLTTSGFTISAGADLPPPDYQPADQVAFLDGLKGAQWRAAVLAGDRVCTPPGGTQVAEAVRLKDFVAIANAAAPRAVLSSICSGDLEIPLADALANFLTVCD